MNSEIEGKVHAVVSVNAFENVDPALVRRSPISFEGEDTGSRLARRARHWIPQVAWRHAR